MSGVPESEWTQTPIGSREFWANLAGARIFITGGTGFFGKWLLEGFYHASRTADLKINLCVLSRNPERFLAEMPHLRALRPIQMVHGDVRGFDYPQGQFTHVIHGATEASAKLNAESPLIMLDTIIEGTRRVLEFAATCGTKRFLFVSSGAVYGRQPPELEQVPESFMGGPNPLEPVAVYSEAKRLAENLCAIYRARSGGSLQTVIARAFAFVGPWLPLDAHFAVGNFIRDGIAGKPIQIKGDGTPFRSYLYGTDLCEWLWTMLIAGGDGKAYNVGSEEGMPIRKIAEAVANQAGGAVEVALQPKPSLPERYVPSTQLARNELGLTQRVTFEEGVRRTLRWHGFTKA